MASSAIFQTAALNKGEEHTKSTIKYLQGCFPSDSSTHQHTSKQFGIALPTFREPFMSVAANAILHCFHRHLQNTGRVPCTCRDAVRVQGQRAAHSSRLAVQCRVQHSSEPYSLSTRCTPFLIASSLGQHTPETIRNTSGMCVW